MWTIIVEAAQTYEKTVAILLKCFADQDFVQCPSSNEKPAAGYCGKNALLPAM